MNAHIPPNQGADDDVAVDYETLDNGMDEILNNGMEEKEELQEANKCRKNTARIVLALIVIGFIIYIIVDSQGANNVKRLTQDFLQWVEDNPAEGVFAFVGVYIIATVLFIPGSILTLGAGFVFGNAFGVGLGATLACVAVFCGASLGAIAAFLLGRYLLREPIQKFSLKFPVFHAIDSALENNGLRIVTLLRLSPIVPFNAFNYIVGVTAVSLRSYVIACVGMLPGTILYVFIGSSAGSIVESASSGGGKILTIVLIVVGVVFGVGAIAVVTYYAKKELKKILEENQAEDDGDSTAIEIDPERANTE
eukprot:scaffold2612_cov267-Chaetoceros_neogracile.AAC.20